ncbi:MAG: diguanylate cyclase domain-containing protein, partial [Monoglobus pectinilyticus]
SKGVVTVSIGVVPIKYNCKPNFEQLLDNADKALYSAKRTGKDKTVIFCDDFNEPDIHGHYSRVHT